MNGFVKPTLPPAKPQPLIQFLDACTGGTGAPQELKTLLAAGAAPVCGASFTRQAITLALGETAAELALDLGFLFRGERKAPLCEVELELKFGDENAVKELADELASKYELTEEPRSKFVRASSL